MKTVFKKIMRRLLSKSDSEGSKIVAIGGGTGLSTMLRGMKKYTDNLTAIVTVADDGGGSGLLRQDLGILPPGDIRNCILALAETEPLMEKLLRYRFTEGSLKGQSFGNLFLAAMDGISENFEEAIKRVSDVLKVTGRVLPVTLNNVNIEAELENGDIVQGETKIGHAIADTNSRIKEVRLIPADAEPLPEVIRAIYEADMIILGPGSLYTSITPNLIVKGVSEAILKSRALKVYVCNLMTQPGETDDMTAYQHAMALCGHAGGKIMDYCIVNKEEIPNHFIAKYEQDNSKAVEVNHIKFGLAGIKLIEGNFVKDCGEFVRHDYDKLAQTLAELLLNETCAKNKCNLFNYYKTKTKLRM